MYRILLADSEESARHRLRAAPDWSRLEMQVVGEAGSAAETLHMIGEHRPDVVILDAASESMNGMEFVALLHTRFPELVLVLHTASRRFEDARQALRLHVFDYLLKPLVPSELQDCLLRVNSLLKQNDRSGDALRSADSTPIEQILSYMHGNYADWRLTLSTAAELFDFSPSYLSRKFRQETGQSFVASLTELRMEHARTLAARGVRMSQAAGMVGIPDPNYFGRCFKKYNGVSYTEYMKAVSGRTASASEKENEP